MSKYSDLTQTKHKADIWKLFYINFNIYENNTF